jgi:predicted helicase
MNESDRTSVVLKYLEEVCMQLESGHAREHAYRPALERLISSFEDVLAVNDPRRSENGNPDFVFLRKSNNDLILGYAEAKDITVDLDKTLKTEQLRRYAGYEKLFLTNYRDFIFLANGEEYLRISLGELKEGKFNSDRTQLLRLANELQSFLEKKPEAIRSGRRLAVIMGGKARRIRDNVVQYLEQDDAQRNDELEKIYELMKRLLVHDLTHAQFADLYAQTLVYGLFAARYNDETPDDFDRREAVEAVPKTNPFLRQFFNHIAGADFDVRLRYIVDELCEVFAISDIRALVKHQATKFAVDDEQDLTIHFYEDFLKEYDPVMRQKMGVYYTPVPVVRYIVRSVDKILKEEFGVVRGLASDETITHTVDTQPWRKKGERKDRLTKDIEVPRVQVLDPAVGTATFLNETIKHIYKDFEGQEGRWPAYVKNNLIKRLHGFELMMAPYTIAHLKLSMTLKETGVNDINERLGVYLTNTLEEGAPTQQDLLSLLGLAGAVSEESQHAAEIKTNHPVMVVLGNPPYAVESSNKTKYAESLVDKYRVEPGGIQRLQERNSKMIGDDYVKFIAFAEDMISKNVSGVVAMITNNGYLDNPTFRGMRWQLRKAFDKIYILNLHGNSNKKETSPDGSKDENVFDIQQGVGVILAVKTSPSAELAEIYHADLYGLRKDKFRTLNESSIDFRNIVPDEMNVMFVPFSNVGQSVYDEGIKLNELFYVKAAGIKTSSDSTSIAFSKQELQNQIENAPEIAYYDDERVKNILYRPFDIREVYYDPKIVKRDRYKQIKHSLHENIAILSGRFSKNGIISQFLVTDLLSEMKTAESTTGSYHFPLYLYADNGEKTTNFDQEKLNELLEQCLKDKDNVGDITGLEPEDIFDYIYASLYSPSYREKYKEFLKIDFPRIPKPKTFDDFYKLAKYGKQLRELHLMKSPALNSARNTTFPVTGDDIVDKISFVRNAENHNDGASGRVHINDTQYFGNISVLAWETYIGGYQPAQKWLKDRKGRPLSDTDLDHYQNIIQVLVETDRIMNEIG